MKMKKVFFVLMPCIAFCLTSATLYAEDRNTMVKDELLRHVCYEKYWNEYDYAPGSQFSYEYLFSGDRLYILVDGLQYPKKNRPEVSEFFRGYLKDGRLDIGLSLTEYGWERGSFADMGETRRIFASKDAVSGTLAVPADCTPRYDPSTPEKERMLDKVGYTMKTVIEGMAYYKATMPEAKEYYAGYVAADEYELTVADFNVDYPSTFVMVRPGNLLYIVDLHNRYDDGGYMSDFFDDYVMRDLIQGDAQAKALAKLDPSLNGLGELAPGLVDKIKKHPIVRKLKMSQSFEGIPSAGRTPSESDRALARRALTRRFCSERYWLGKGYEEGSTVSYDALYVKDKFYALITAGVPPRCGFYIGSLEGGRSALTQRPEVYDCSRGNWKIFTGPMGARKAENDYLVMPKDCSPSYAPSTPEKARMLEIIEDSIRFTLIRNSEGERRLDIKRHKKWERLPPAVTAVIADFNMEDNWTFVLVEPLDIIFRVFLHDDYDYWSDLPERVGRVNMSEEFFEDKDKALKARVRGRILSRTLERKAIFFP